MLRDLDAPRGHLVLGILAFALGAAFLWWSVSAALAGELMGTRPAHSRFAGDYGLPNWAGFVIGSLFWALAAMLAGDYVRARRGARGDEVAGAGEDAMPAAADCPAEPGGSSVGDPDGE